MSETTKLQQYKYSLRTTSIQPKTFPNGYLCGNKFYVFPVPPEDALTIENLYLHLKIRFGAGVASGSRMITKIGIANNRPLYGLTPSRLRTYDVNWVADADRYIDKKIDLSALLDKEAVAYKDYFDTDDGVTPYTYVYIELPAELDGFGSNGDLWQCRMDALYTTLGIQ